MEQKRNLWVIPTDEPSRLYRNTSEELSFTSIEFTQQKNGFNINQNICITNDEKPKDGDWFTDDNNSLKRSYKLSHVQFANPKKIILTDNQDLIKCGVQAIDDEFLDWFVKNPSCEYVPIITTIVSNESTYKINIGFESWRKHIIIPKEEPKQETLEEFAKQEAIKQYSEDTFGNLIVRKSIEKGIKYQQEQDKKMYSEEDLRTAYNAENEGWVGFDFWFEQFKKK
jgi:hypothetical protein